MARRKKKSTTPPPEECTAEQHAATSKAHSAEARLEGGGGLQSDTDQYATVKLSGPPPPSGKEWLANAAARLAADGPERVTDAARQLEKEMAEVFLRRRVDETFTWASIKNFLTRRKFWPSRKRRTP
jgi:hypothetical protein